MTETDFRLILMASHSGPQIAALVDRMNKASYDELSEWMSSLIRSTDYRIKWLVINALMQRILTLMDQRVSDLRDEATWAGMGEDL